MFACDNVTMYDDDKQLACFNQLSNPHVALFPATIPFKQLHFPLFLKTL